MRRLYLHHYIFILLALCLVTIISWAFFHSKIEQSFSLAEKNPDSQSSTLRQVFKNEDVVMEKMVDIINDDTKLTVNGSLTKNQNIFVISPNKNSSTKKIRKYGRHYSQECLEPDSTLQDLLCMTRLPFLPEVKNPCWLEQEGGDNPRLRCLPYYHILGCAKCASTDLYARLTQHPFIIKNGGLLNKEALWWSWKRYGIQNFAVRETSSFEDYTRLFDNTAEAITNFYQNNITMVSKVITGDASPPDFWDFRAWPLIAQNKGLNEPIVLTPHLMKHVYRHPKFILLLRNPTDRLYSDYFFLKQGDSEETFHEDVVDSISILFTCLNKHSERFCYFDSNLFADLKCRIHYGCYYVFLKEWFDVFDVDQFYIARTEDYSNDIDKHLAQIYKFLELEPLSTAKLDSIESKSKSRVNKTKKREMLTKTRELLDKFYSSCNEKLADMLHNKKYLWLDTNIRTRSHKHKHLKKLTNLWPRT